MSRTTKEQESSHESDVLNGGASDADVEDETEEIITEHEWEGSQKNEDDHAGTLEGNGENSEIEVSAHELLYHFIQLGRPPVPSLLVLAEIGHCPLYPLKKIASPDPPDVF